MNDFTEDFWFCNWHLHPAREPDPHEPAQTLTCWFLLALTGGRSWPPTA